MQFFQSFLLKGNFFGTHATKYDFYSFEYPLWSVATHLSKWLPPLVEPIAIGQATFRITTTKQFSWRERPDGSNFQSWGSTGEPFQQGYKWRSCTKIALEYKNYDLMLLAL